jgi:small basic protein (TIGR04137 family)
LKVHGGLIKARSVLTRTERIARLTEEGKFDPEKDSPLALPKTKVRHSKAGTKTKKAEEKPAAAEGVPAAEGATTEAEAEKAARPEKAAKPEKKG